MSAELNSKIGAPLDPMGADTHGSEPMTGDESEGLMTHTSLEVESMFGSNAVECFHGGVDPPVLGWHDLH